MKKHSDSIRMQKNKAIKEYQSRSKLKIEITNQQGCEESSIKQSIWNYESTGELPSDDNELKRETLC